MSGRLVRSAGSPGPCTRWHKLGHDRGAFEALQLEGESTHEMVTRINEALDRANPKIEIGLARLDRMLRADHEGSDQA